MKRLEFHISYICPHKCIFCSEYDRMNNFKNFPLSLFQIKTILIDRRKKWFNHVNFTWWEPTIVPNFLELLEFTKKLWYTIYVWTNWTMFYSDDFSYRALKFIDELSLSVHWFDELTCEKQIWLKYHFRNFEKIVYNINRHKNDNFFFLNIVLNRHNYIYIFEILKFVITTWYNFNQVLVSVVAPEWIARYNYWDLVFDLEDFKKYIKLIIDFSKSNNKILRFFWLPSCILWDEYLDYANDVHWESRNTIERFYSKNWNVSLKDEFSFDNTRERCYVDKCKSCKWKWNQCSGVFKKYLEFYNF